MWKFLFAVAIILNLVAAQRSSYAPRPGTNSKLLPRYRKNDTDTGLGTRGGDEDSDVTSSTLPPELQGTLEDHRFVQRVSGWPEDRQPFWFKNRYAISSMRDRKIDGGSVDRGVDFENQRPRPRFQSSFQGASRVRGRNRDRGEGFARFAEDDNNDFDPLFFYLRKPYGD